MKRLMIFLCALVVTCVMTTSGFARQASTEQGQKQEAKKETKKAKKGTKKAKKGKKTEKKSSRLSNSWRSSVMLPEVPRAFLVSDRTRKGH